VRRQKIVPASAALFAGLDKYVKRRAALDTIVNYPALVRAIAFINLFLINDLDDGTPIALSLEKDITIFTLLAAAGGLPTPETDMQFSLDARAKRLGYPHHARALYTTVISHSHRGTPLPCLRCMC
jgi:hypothetical protein